MKFYINLPECYTEIQIHESYVLDFPHQTPNTDVGY